MAWLRVDDGFTDHPKIVALGTPARRWTWLRVLSYTARYRSPDVPAGLREIISEATPKYLADCVEIGLIDRAADGSMAVHDWQKYNLKDPLKAERQAKWRAKKAAETDDPVDEPVDADVDGAVDASRVGARARTQPSPSPTPLSAKAEEQNAAAADQDHWQAREDPVVRLLTTMRHKDARTEHVLRSFVGKVPEAAFDYTRDELERTRDTTEHDAKLAVHVLNRIRREGTLTTPAPAANGSGESHARAQAPPAPNPVERRDRYVRGDGHLLPADELEYQLANMGAGEDELVGLLELAADLRSADA